MIISHFPSGAGNSVPAFLYTGQHALEMDTNGWKLKLLSSGTLTLNQPTYADLFAVGGGGCGGDASASDNGAGGGIMIKTGAGGGSGFTETQKKIVLPAGTYNVHIGDGGYKNNSTLYDAGPTYLNHNGEDLIYAEPGVNADSYTAGNGGSGGGSGSYYTGSSFSAYRGNGGTDGGNGTGTNKGTGQGTTTSAFEENTVLYAAGGNGGDFPVEANGADGADNTGNGGSGGSYGGTISDATSVGVFKGTGGSGGSGILIIRNVRE